MAADIKTTTVVSARRDSDESHSVTSPRVDSAAPSTVASSNAPPHPCPAFQAAFEESINEADDDPPSFLFQPDPETRRQELLNAKRYDDSWVARWRQRRGAKYHPLQKLMAQIVFGIHLLQQQQAKSSEEVVKILQSHVNEVDSFLERTAEDLDLATADIDERLRHLKLPMEHLDVFKIMLDDATFRSQLLDGNGKIEKIVERTTKAKKGALYDAHEGIRAVRELNLYLSDVEPRWPRSNKDIAEVFEAMRGNEEGWLEYLEDLKVKAGKLETHLTRLNGTLLDMASLAMEAASRGSSSDALSKSIAPGLRSKFSAGSSGNVHSKSQTPKDKPLPTAPKTNTVYARSPSPATRRLPLPNATRSARTPSPSSERAATADADARSRRRGSGQAMSPLRSHPPKDGHDEEQKVSKEMDAYAFIQGSLSPRRPVGVSGPIINNRTSSITSGNTNGDYASSLHSESSDLTRTGFARRMSKRMKHLPQSTMRGQASDSALYSTSKSADGQTPKRTAVTKPSLPNIYDNEDDDGDAPTALPAFSQINPPRTVNNPKTTPTHSLRSLNVRTSVLAAKEKAKGLRNLFHRRASAHQEDRSIAAS